MRVYGPEITLELPMCRQTLDLVNKYAEKMDLLAKRLRIDSTKNKLYILNFKKPFLTNRDKQIKQSSLFPIIK